jgi:hypothetical protein
MKSTALLMLLFALLVTTSSGQNLVQNSSFNMNTLVLPCENDLDWNGITIAARNPVNKVQNWSQPSLSSTDYYHECAQGPNPALLGPPWFDVPYNSYATGNNQPDGSPVVGKPGSYIGLYAFDWYNPTPLLRYREYGTQQLNTALVPGVLYKVRMKVAFAQTAMPKDIPIPVGNTQPIHEIGILFTTANPVGLFPANGQYGPITLPAMPNDAQLLRFTNPMGQAIQTQAGQWQQFERYVSITGNNKGYLTIGYFEDLFGQPTEQYYLTYYFIDDVEIYPADVPPCTVVDMSWKINEANSNQTGKCCYTLKITGNDFANPITQVEILDNVGTVLQTNALNLGAGVSGNVNYCLPTGLTEQTITVRVSAGSSYVCTYEFTLKCKCECDENPIVISLVRNNRAVDGMCCFDILVESKESQSNSCVSNALSLGLTFSDPSLIISSLAPGLTVTGGSGAYQIVSSTSTPIKIEAGKKKKLGEVCVSAGTAPVTANLSSVSSNNDACWSGSATLTCAIAPENCCPLFDIILVDARGTAGSNESADKCCQRFAIRKSNSYGCDVYSAELYIDGALSQTVTNGTAPIVLSAYPGFTGIGDRYCFYGNHVMRLVLKNAFGTVICERTYPVSCPVIPPAQKSGAQGGLSPLGGENQSALCDGIRAETFGQASTSVRVTSAQSATLNITLVDVVGRLIASKTVTLRENEEHVFDTGDLLKSKGAYYLNIEADGCRKTLTIVR